ncbi:hypothetical protein AB0M39_10915 [Streptomyces sp. NPDC051907]|uniref:hypothetical protein n=1 Tax=Streptomyces sp. NPDC051907 TaxID=3155284 RepID=UPI00343148AF
MLTGDPESRPRITELKFEGSKSKSRFAAPCATSSSAPTTPHDAVEQFSIGKLENLGARRPEEFDLQELHDHLDTLEWVSDTECEAYGLDAARISSLRQ